VGPAGHAGLLEFVPGKPLRELSGQAFVAACEQVGLALARLQASDAELDRVWTAQDEIDHLQRHRGSHGRCWRSPGGRSVVPAHRDLHLAQVVVAAGAVRLIDLDDATMAPAGLDVGNFLAHLDQEGAVGNRPGDEVAAAAAARRRQSPRRARWPGRSATPACGARRRTPSAGTPTAP
jgi:Ser/Thr protein kinase RdoA (MazF antagonist)